jgi:hypothetical protein
VIAIVGDSVISHAGVLGEWTTRVDAVNLEARCFLDGQGARPSSLDAESSPVWTRALGGANVDCSALGAALHALGAKRMIVAHTVQEAGITSACDGAVWRIDTGLARVYGGKIQVLEISSDPPKIVEGTR